MPLRWDVTETGLRQVLTWACWLFAVFMIAVGVIICGAPEARFGSSWHYLLSVAAPGGRYAQGGLFLLVGAGMLVATFLGWQRAMSLYAFLGGLGQVVLGTFLVVGAMSTPSGGVLGGPYCYLAGALFMMLSVLLSRHRSRV